MTLGFESSAARRRVLAWLNDGLRAGRPGRLSSEYPLLFDRNASALHVTLWEGEAPVAFCTLWAVTFRVGIHRLRTGMVSLVYTDPAVRGRGHATRIVRRAIAEARALELGLVLLWSELADLYRPLGFDRAGCESLLVLDAPLVDRAIEGSEAAAPLVVEPPQGRDWPAIEQLRGHRTCQLELDPGELSRARTLPDLSARVARDDSGVRGFAMRGRGDDFEEVIHEWGGDPDAALHCCRALLRDAEPWNELLLLTPASDDALAWRLRRAGGRRVHQPMAWMRIASERAFAADIAAMLPEPLDLSMSGSQDEGSASPVVHLRSPLGERRIAQHHLLTALFGEGTGPAPSPNAACIAPVIGDGNALQLPLPFFVWGLESI